MLNTNLNYPYPIIREYADDYETTIFTGELTVCIEAGGYVVYPKFNINNKDIESFLKEGILTYAMEIQCSSTWFRHLYLIKDNQSIRLDPVNIHERVDVMPCIIATKSIMGFSNEDFSNEYQNIKFDLNAGDVIGIGTKKSFDALYQNDIIKDGRSIVDIRCGEESLKRVECSFGSSVIKVKLPKTQYENYTDCGFNRSKYKMLNAIVIVPVLVEAIEIIAEDDNDPDHISGYESQAWYKTIVANLKRYAENQDVAYRKLLSMPFSTAELLLKDNLAEALKFLADME